jgi:2-hydroxychromene-2-carboxylate isomerase
VRYYKKDLADWARAAGLDIKTRPTVFPVNSVKAMRGCILLEPDGKLVPFARALFESYWRDDQDISRDDVLAEICGQLGVDRERFFTGIAQQSVKDRLRANTDELMERGGFGSPTLYLDRHDMYFGNDRLPLLRTALERRTSRSG